MKKPSYDELIAALSESDHRQLRMKYAAVKVERDALAAQVERLRETIVDATNKGVATDTGRWIYSINTSVLDKTPPQCLVEHDREVAVKVIEKVASELKTTDYCSGCETEIVDYSELVEYISKIKTGEIEPC